jgi:hypothetical protein
MLHFYKGGLLMPSKATNKIPKTKKGGSVKMGAKISNQINTNHSQTWPYQPIVQLLKPHSIVNKIFA